MISEAGGTELPPLALTMGEPAGIGGEIALKAWRHSATAGGAQFFLLDDPQRLSALSADLGLACDIEVVSTPQEVDRALFSRALPVLPVALAAEATAGKIEPANAPAVIESIERAVALAQAGEVTGVVTNPINKKVLYGAGFAHPGHTEFLAALAGPHAQPVMMLTCPGLRVVPVTVHMPLSDVPATLSTDLIVTTGRIVAAALRNDYGIVAPRLAVAGLNPHAGEGGAIGSEDEDIVAPACRALADEGIEVAGPLPADTMFHEHARARYDAALCMYHDQALIPLKTLDFYRGVNVTLGLPFVRTSPDHGTALNIAGKGVADPGSLIAAMEEAALIARHRRAALVGTHD